MFVAASLWIGRTLHRPRPESPDSGGIERGRLIACTRLRTGMT